MPCKVQFLAHSSYYEGFAFPVLSSLSKKPEPAVAPADNMERMSGGVAMGSYMLFGAPPHKSPGRRNRVGEANRRKQLGDMPVKSIKPRNQARIRPTGYPYYTNLSLAESLVLFGAIVNSHKERREQT